MKLKPLLLLASFAAFALLPAAASAAPYSQPYTASFGPSLTGQAANVVFYVFDAAGVCRVGPASYVNAAGATVTGPNNAPTSAESRDYTGTGGTGAYYANLPLDTTWGPLHIKAVITGQAGVVAEGSLVNRGSDVADGYSPARAVKLDGIGGAVTSVTGTVGSVIAPVSLTQADEAALGLIPGISTTTAKLTFDSSSILYADAKTLPATAPAGYGGGSGGTASSVVFGDYPSGQAPASTYLIPAITHNASGQPVLAWTADSTATGYIVLRSIDNRATYQTQGTLPAGTLTYTDTTRPAGGTVYYHVVPTH